MNNILKRPIERLGFDFITADQIPKGKNEFYLRDQQQTVQRTYRSLTATEIKKLIAGGNTCTDWKQIWVSEIFDPELIKHCQFFGLIRIGNLSSCYLEFHDLKIPSGLYNSTIISCDFGDHVAIQNVSYLSHYIIGNETILTDIHELHVSNHAKFGNGIIKKGESESVRIWLELCNENAGRKILPFDGMQAADAWLWTRNPSDELLVKKFIEFTEKRFDKKRGYYGFIGDRTVIKSTRTIKDVWIGSDCYIKGANKLKNLTINSSVSSPSQIGEGCELVNGIIGYGCRIFYGVKAVRFIMASHSQLKYGARLINSFLGDNSTISCCEVLNSLIFPAHEQHHNNSFLCASMVMGQSNMAAGATIGSNHNSRGADGELIAGRGFWPGLCVSLKHNSRFASFTLIAKGDFPAELDIKIPFSLVNNDVSNNQLTIMPAYWFMYNLYALARNESKYATRDKRQIKNQLFEYDVLAPDTINEMMEALIILQKSVGEAYYKKVNKKTDETAAIKKGKKLLDEQADLTGLRFYVHGFENSNRPCEIIKLPEAYQQFIKMIRYYGTLQLIEIVKVNQFDSFESFKKIFGKADRKNWLNAGGQLIPEASINRLLNNIRKEKITSWEQVHEYYHQETEDYPLHKARHAWSALLEIMNIKAEDFSKEIFYSLLDEAVETKTTATKNIKTTREKDYNNPFRKMVYASKKEMDFVIGPLKDNSFINQQEKELIDFKKSIAGLKKQLQRM